MKHRELIDVATAPIHEAAIGCFDKLAGAGMERREAFETVLLNLLIEAVLAAQAAQVSTSDFQILSAVARRKAAESTGQGRDRWT